MQSVPRSSKRNYTSVPPAFVSRWFGREGGRTRTPSSHCTPVPSVPGGNDSFAFNIDSLPLSNTACKFCTAGSKEQPRISPTGLTGCRAAERLCGHRLRGCPGHSGKWPEPHSVPQTCPTGHPPRWAVLQSSAGPVCRAVLQWSSPGALLLLHGPRRCQCPPPSSGRCT